MAHATPRTRLTEAAFMLPFMLGGILLAAYVYGWFYDSLTGDSREWLFVLSMGLAAVGITLGALVGYGVLVFFLTWLAPASPLLALDDDDKLTIPQRIFLPAFLAVRRLAQRMAPTPRQ